MEVVILPVDIPVTRRVMDLSAMFPGPAFQTAGKERYHSLTADQAAKSYSFEHGIVRKLRRCFS